MSQQHKPAHLFGPVIEDFDCWQLEGSRLFLFWQKQQKVLPPIIKSIRHVQCCATDELCYLLACNLYQNKEYLVCSLTSNIDVFADFHLSTVKNCEFFPQKFQHKNKRPILPLRSGISYKPMGNTVHPWHNIEHALWFL